MNKSHLIHGIWALVVVGAFNLGGRGDSSSADDSPEAIRRSSSARAAALAGESGPGGRSSRTSSGRGKAGGPASEFQALFGNIVSAANLDLLTEQALRDSNPITRRLAFSRLLEAMTPENAESIRAKLVELGADGGQWQDFHYSWGAIAGKAAFEHAGQTEERDMAATMTGWAAANPAEALAMLDNLPENMRGQRDELTASIVTGLSHSDPSKATDLVLRLGREGNERAGNLMEIVARETLRAQGPEQASLWASVLPDGPIKGNAMGQIAEAYVRKDPLAAAKWAEKFADQDYAGRTIAQVGGGWAQRDPLAAVDWLQGLPESGGQKSGLRNAFGDWEDKDPAAAGKYLLAMPKSPQRDSAISGFATGYAWQDPQLAISWAQDIQDPGLRQSSLSQAGQAYFRRDPEAARAWLPTSGLSEEAQQQVLNPPRR
jgi:hypothetical protein